MKKTAIVFILLIAFLSFPVFAEKTVMPPITMPTVASNGFGGHHLAYTDNIFALLVNPAAIMRVQQKSFFTLAPSVFNPQSTLELSRSLADLASGDTSALGNAADTLSKQKGKIALGFELREFPFSFAWVANGFGFGLWNRTFVNANIQGTYLEAHIYSDVMLPIGFAFKIFSLEGHTVDTGLTLKPFARIRAREKEKITALIGDSSDFSDRITLPLIMGGGLDIGLLYRWDIGFQAGLTFSDILTRGKVVQNFMDTKDENSYYVPFTMNAGLAYEFRIGRYWENAPSFFKNIGFALAFDWRDLGNAFNQDDYLNNRNYKLDLGFGFQVFFWDVIKVRIGMNEMLPAFGLGFDLGPVKIDAAYYGREFGYEPGQLSAAVVEFSLSVRPGAKKRSWPWTRRSLIGLITGIETIRSDEQELEESAD